MIHVGTFARELRERLGLTQHQMAEELGITNVHLSNVENDKSFPSQQLMDRYSQRFDIDLYVYAWCRAGETEKLPPGIRGPATELARACEESLERKLRDRGRPHG